MNNWSKNFRRWPYASILSGRSTDNIGSCGTTLIQDSARLGSRLCLAILRGDNREAEKMLDSGAPIDYQDAPDGWTPLIYSIYYDNPAGRKMLFDRGGNPRTTDFAGRTTLMFAAINGDLRLIGELLARGVSPDEEDCHGKTALDFAGEYRNSDCFALLETITRRRAAVAAEPAR